MGWNRVKVGVEAKEVVRVAPNLQGRQEGWPGVVAVHLLGREWTTGQERGQQHLGTEQDKRV